MRDGLVSKDELEEILAEQRDTRQQRVSGRRLGEILINKGRVTPTQVARLVAEQYELPFVDFDIADVDLRLAKILTEDDARRLSALPISRRADGTYLLAIADPGTVLFSEELRAILGSVPNFAVVGPDAIERAIDFVYSQPLVPDSSLVVEQTVEGVVLSFPPGGPVISVFEEPELEAPQADASPLLGALLVRDGYLTESELEAALAQQRLSPELRLGEILVERGAVTPAVVARLIAEQYELRFFDLGALDIDRRVAARLPAQVARALVAVPIAEHEDGSLDVAISDPTRAAFSDELHNALGVPLTIVMAAPDAILGVLDELQAPSFTFVPTYHDAAAALEQAETVEEEVESVAQAAQHGVVESAELGSRGDEPEEFEPATWQIVHEPIGAAAAPSEVPAEDLRLSEESEEQPVGDQPADAPRWGDPEPEVAELAFEPSLTELVPPTNFAVPLADDETRWEGRLELVEELVEEGEPEARDEEEGAPEMRGTEDVSHVFDLPFMSVLDSAAQTEDEDTRESENAALDVEIEAGPALAEPVFTAFSDERASFPEDADTLVRFDRVEAEAEGDVDVTVEESGPELELFASESDVEVAGDPVDDELDAVEAALAAGASTLHFAPCDDGFAVRARVDGLVRDLGIVSPTARDVLVERLETRGAARSYVSETPRGEKTTLFVREPAGAPKKLDELGPGSALAGALQSALDRAAGAILVCGPRGSGTTTTLYAALAAFAGPDRIVTTFEYPVERLLDGSDQFEMDPAHGITFASSLRDVRFTDPDAVLVGDLPDLETTELALRVAADGRLVLASFRAPGSAAAVRRLVEMGIDTATLASTLGCVVAQRLVRTVCPSCRETYYASEAERALLGVQDDGGPRLLARGAGCGECGGSGFRGRTGVFEVMPMGDEVRELVGEGASTKKIQRAAVSAGMRTLREEALRLCLEGVTTVAEVERVLGLAG